MLYIIIAGPEFLSQKGSNDDQVTLDVLHQSTQNVIGHAHTNSGHTHTNSSQAFGADYAASNSGQELGTGHAQSTSIQVLGGGPILGHAQLKSGQTQAKTSTNLAPSLPSSTKRKQSDENSETAANMQPEKKSSFNRCTFSGPRYGPEFALNVV